MKPLTSLEKRDLLAARKFNAGEVRAYGDEFFKLERYGEAFEFYRKVNDRDCVRKIKDVAIQIGDPEVLWRIQQYDGSLVSNDDWTACGDNAMKLGKYRSAEYCYQKTGNETKRAEALNAIKSEAVPP